jgi:hypothetical protein
VLAVILSLVLIGIWIAERARLRLRLGSRHGIWTMPIQRRRGW